MVAVALVVQNIELCSVNVLVLLVLKIVKLVSTQQQGSSEAVFLQAL